VQRGAPDLGSPAQVEPDLAQADDGPRVVPLSPPAVALIEAVPRTERPHVFPSARGTGPIVGLRKVWLDLCRRAEIRGATLHTLRHSLASTAVMGGASLYLVGKALGHAQGATTERYAHLALDPVKAAVSGAAGQIDAAMRQGASNVVPLLRGRRA
jgi:integrase